MRSPVDTCVEEDTWCADTFAASEWRVGGTLAVDQHVSDARPDAEDRLQRKGFESSVGVSRRRPREQPAVPLSYYRDTLLLS